MEWRQCKLEAVRLTKERGVSYGRPQKTLVFIRRNCAIGCLRAIRGMHSPATVTCLVSGRRPPSLQ
jgi:hypothetical protein